MICVLIWLPGWNLRTRISLTGLENRRSNTRGSGRVSSFLWFCNSYFKALIVTRMIMIPFFLCVLCTMPLIPHRAA